MAAAAKPQETDQAPSPIITGRRNALITIGVMMAMIMQILDSTIANVALPHMQTSLGATMESVTWVLTSYIIASAIAIPTTGWLADQFGSRRLFLVSVAGFVVASILCGTSTSLTEMVLYRIAQGIAAAFIGPLSQTIMLNMNPPEKHARAMAVWGMGVMIGPIMGPILGGWLTESYNWRWIFYVNVPIGIVTFALLWVLLPSSPKVKRNFDYFGFIMLAVALFALQMLLDRGTQEDWYKSTEIWIETGVAVAAFWMFWVHIFMGKKPLFKKSMILDRNFLTAIFFMIIVGVIMMSSMALLPPMMQRIYGYPVMDTGILLAPRGIGILITMGIVGKLSGRIDPRYMVGLGFIMTSYSMWMMTWWSIDMGQGPIITSGLLQGLGLGFVFGPLNALAFVSIPMSERTDGASLLYLSRTLGGSVGISIATAVLGMNYQISHSDLAAKITPYSIPGVDPGSADRFGAIGDMAMVMLDNEISKQALMISYLDDFYMLTLVSLAALPLIFLLKKPPPILPTPQ